MRPARFELELPFSRVIEISAVRKQFPGSQYDRSRGRGVPENSRTEKPENFHWPLVQITMLQGPQRPIQKRKNRTNAFTGT